MYIFCVGFANSFLHPSQVAFPVVVVVECSSGTTSRNWKLPIGTVFQNIIIISHWYGALLLHIQCKRTNGTFFIA
jgi:hypothetical protein